MNRRHFLLSLTGFTALGGCGKPAPRISRVSFAPIEGRFHKFVAMNSQADRPNGETYQNTLVRILTDGGIEGIGVVAGRNPEEGFAEAVRTLIGTNPLEIYHMEEGRIVGVSPQFQALLNNHRHLDGPLFDLIGKLTERPCWQLIGEPVRDRVEVYDGTIYFSDVWFKDRGVEAVVDEAKESVAAGHRGMKLKVGRGFKWMEKSAGLQRDIEVLQAVREAVGPETKIMADANNGYQDDLEGAVALLRGTKDVKLYWIEEIFREDPDQYRRLREQMKEAGIETFVADGESAREPQHFEPYLKPERLIDVVQLDIRRGGLLGCKEAALMAAAAQAIAVPHNWASQVGLYMSLHLARAVKNAVAAEDERSRCDVILEDGYRFEGGFYTVPDSPGLGIRVDEEVYQEKYQAGEVVV